MRKIAILKRAPNYSLKVQWDEGGGRILLDEDKGGGAVMQWPIRFQCAGGLDFSRTPLFIYIYLTICLLHFDLRGTIRNVTVAEVGEWLQLSDLARSLWNTVATYCVTNYNIIQLVRSHIGCKLCLIWFLQRRFFPPKSIFVFVMKL